MNLWFFVAYCTSWEGKRGETGKNQKINKWGGRPKYFYSGWQIACLDHLV